jgi:hypothetical protein
VVWWRAARERRARPRPRWRAARERRAWPRPRWRRERRRGPGRGGSASSPELLHRQHWLLHPRPSLHCYRPLELTGKIHRGCSTSAQLLASLASPRPCVSFEPGCAVSCCRSRPRRRFPPPRFAMSTAISSPWLALSSEHLALSSLVLVSSRFCVANRIVCLVVGAQDTPERPLDHRFTPPS